VTNLAARLCDLATDGQILVSRRVRTGAAEEFELREVGMVEVKGFARPVELFEVVAPAREVEEP
jgi:class 3 adenylate cyclase